MSCVGPSPITLAGEEAREPEACICEAIPRSKEDVDEEAGERDESGNQTRLLYS